MYISSKKFVYLEELSTLEPVKLSLKSGEYYVAGRAGGGAGSSGAGGIGGFFENDFKLDRSVDAFVYIGDGGKSYEEGGNGGKYEENLTVQYTVTINPTPSDAIVTLTAYGISLPSSVWDFGAVASASIEETFDGGTIDSAIVEYQDMMPLNYTQEGNSITVAENVTVNYRVEKTGYASVEDSIVVTEDITIPVGLDTTEKTLTIVPNINDATVTLSAPGYSTVTGTGTQSITVLRGTNVTYRVSKVGYSIETDTIPVNDTDSLPITLTPLNYTLTIEPTPNDATVVLTAYGYTQSENSITVPYETLVHCVISKAGYATAEYDYTVTSTHTEYPDPLVANNYKLTVNVIPSGSTVHFSTGTVEGNECTVPYGTSVTYYATKSGYEQSQPVTEIVTADMSSSITLKQLFTLTINPTPNDARVVLNATGYTQSGNAITVSDGTKVTYEVSKEGYTSVGPVTVTVTATDTIPVTLPEELPILVTSSQTKALEAGKYKAILISAGGNGAKGTQASVSGAGAPGGGGGGSGKVSIVTFITNGENVTFSPATSAGGTTSLTGSVLGSIGSITGGSTASNYNGAAGGSGGGGGGNGGVSSTNAQPGGAGGIGGHDGYASSYSGGAGVNGSSTGGSANNGASAGTSSLGNAGSGGQGAVAIQSTLLSNSGFLAATVNSVLAAMAGGGAGSGGHTSRAATLHGGPGGGGGGWFNGTSGSSGVVSSQTVGTGGAGAIIYKLIEKPSNTLDGGLVSETVTSSTDIGSVGDLSISNTFDAGLL